MGPYWAVLILVAAMPPARDPALGRLERAVFDGVNKQRREHGATELHWSAKLAEEARRHALNMAGRRFFSHVDPVRGSLAARLKKDGIRYRASAENIYDEKGFPNPAEQAVESWMRSPGHRRNMLDPSFRETGVGAAYGSDGTVYVDQVFVRP